MHLNSCRIGHFGFNKQLPSLRVRPVLRNGIFFLIKLLHHSVNGPVCADQLDGSLRPHALDAVAVVTPQQNTEVDELELETLMVVVVKVMVVACLTLTQQVGFLAVTFLLLIQKNYSI